MQQLTSANCRVLKDNAIVDKADVLGRLRSAWSLLAKQVQYASGQYGVFTVLYELTQVSQASLLGLGVLLHYNDQRIHYCFLVIEPTLDTHLRYSSLVTNNHNVQSTLLQQTSWDS